MRKHESDDEQALSFRQLLFVLCGVGIMITFMAKVGYDPFPTCTCGELTSDSILLALGAQGDSLVNEYLETESSDLMCAARKKELMKKLKERDKEKVIK